MAQRMTRPAQRPVLHRLAEEVGAAQALDAPAEAVAGAVRSAIPRGPVKDTLSGTPLGHALHPLLTDLPIRRKQSCRGISAAQAELYQTEYDTHYAVVRTYYSAV